MPPIKQNANRKRISEAVKSRKIKAMGQDVEEAQRLLELLAAF